MKKRIISLGASAAILASFYVPAAQAATLTASAVGKIVRIGTWADQPINYYIGGERDVNGDGEKELFLFSTHFISAKEYDTSGVADWESATLRTWLNSSAEDCDLYQNQPGYMSGLSEFEKKLIVPETHKTLINGTLNPDGGQNGIGWNDSWPAVVTNAVGDTDIQTAYYRQTTDYIFIPSLLDMMDYQILPIADNSRGNAACLQKYGEGISNGNWGLTRDGHETDNVRVWYPNNSVTASGANGCTFGIRACMYIRSGSSVTGSGSASDPYQFVVPFEKGAVELSQNGAPIDSLKDGEVTVTAKFKSTLSGKTLTAVLARLENRDGTPYAAEIQTQDVAASDDAAVFTLNVENADSSYLKVFFLDENKKPQASASVIGAEPKQKTVSDTEDTLWANASTEGFSVTVQGGEPASPFANVVVTVSQNTPEGTKIIYSDVKSVQENGSFDFSFLAPGTASGWYDVVIASDSSNDDVKTEIGIAGATLYADTLQSFSNLPKEDIAKILRGEGDYALEYQSFLGRDLYLDEIKTDAIAVLVAEGLKAALPSGGYTEANFKEILNRVVTEVCFDEASAEEKYEMLENARYREILKSSETVQKTAYKMVKESKQNAELFQTITSENVREKLLDAVILKAVELSENAGEVRKIIEESAKEIGISKNSTYDNLSSTKLKKLYDQLVGAECADYSALKSKWESAFNSVKTTTGGAGSGGHNGGGSSKSESGSSSLIPMTGINQIVKETESAPETIRFADVEALTWGKTEILTLAQQGILNGMEKNRFEPEGKVTREQFAKMAQGAWKVIDPKTGIAFVDVAENAWYAEAVRAMAAAGYISGISEDTFGVDRNITRQDMAVILYRILKSQLNVSERTADFTDAEEIADYAKEAVSALVDAGILSGYEDGSFGATREVTRREAAVMIYKALNL